MRIIHIDSRNKTVKHVEIPDDEEGSYHMISMLIGGHFSLPYKFKNGDALYTWDDMFKMPLIYGYTLLGGHQDFYPGNGVIVGLSGPVEVSALSDIDEIKALVIFGTRHRTRNV